MEGLDAALTALPTDVTADLATGVAAGGMAAFLGAYMVFTVIIGLAIYIYMGIALMKIADKLSVPNGWMAFIPIANLYLITQLAGVPWWTMLGVLLAFIPVIGYLASLALSIWWFWKICERLGKEGWWGIVISLVPIANLILIGMLAWGDTSITKQATPAKA